MNKEEEFENACINMNVECFHNSLEGINYKEVPKEIFFACSETDENKEFLQKCFNEFEKTYGRKLKYRFDEIAYISYLETVI